MRAGIVGVGFMGWIHWLAYRQSQTASVAAICTRDAKKRSGDWRGIQGNFGPPGEQVDLTGVRAYASLDELLADPEIDVVDICLPPHLHVDTALRAFAAGKHVFCEKPLALTAADCDRLVEAASQAGRQLLVGQLLPFFPEYKKAIELVQSGVYGRLLGGWFKRVISDPLWIPDFYNPATVGGPLVDLHVHDAHLIRYLFGMPTGVHSRGRMRGEVVEYAQTLFEFADRSLVVGAASGVIQQQGRAFTHGFELHLERATLQYEFAVVGGEPRSLIPLTVYDSDGQASVPELSQEDAFLAEINEVARAVDTGASSPLLGGDLARDAIVLCHWQTDAVRAG